MGDRDQIACRHCSVTGNFLRVRGSQLHTQAIKIENVADKRKGAMFTNKITVQHTYEAAQLDNLTSLLSDFPEKRVFDRFVALDAAGGQPIDWLLVAMFRVQKNLAIGLTDRENNLPSSVRILLPAIGAHRGVRFNEVAATKRLPVFDSEGMKFRLIDSGDYTGVRGHRRIVRVEERYFPMGVATLSESGA